MQIPLRLHLPKNCGVPRYAFVSIDHVALLHPKAVGAQRYINIWRMLRHRSHDAIHALYLLNITRPLPPHRKKTGVKVRATCAMVCALLETAMEAPLQLDRQITFTPFEAAVWRVQNEPRASLPPCAWFPCRPLNDVEQHEWHILHHPFYNPHMPVCLRNKHGCDNEFARRRV